VDQPLIQLVWVRAERRCEYCRIPQDCDDDPFQIDHVIARKHGGATTANNLALSCFHCNVFKGPNIAGIDPRTRRVVRLFNPRRQKWATHFRWRGAFLFGRTPGGRATVATLNVNDGLRVELRARLATEGLFPPE
jgi:5-methylcytosine-specific restriction endonuclease McrA